MKAPHRLGAGLGVGLMLAGAAGLWAAPPPKDDAPIGARLLWQEYGPGRYRSGSLARSQAPLGRPMVKPLIWAEVDLVLLKPVARMDEPRYEVRQLSTGTLLAHRDLGDWRVRVRRPGWSRRWLVAREDGDTLMVEALDPRGLWPVETWAVDDPFAQVPELVEPPPPDTPGLVFLPGEAPTAWRLGEGGQLVLVWRGLPGGRYPVGPRDIPGEFDGFLDRNTRILCLRFPSGLRPWQRTLAWRQRERLLDPWGPTLLPPWADAGPAWFQPLDGHALLAYRDGQLARWEPARDRWKVQELPEFFQCGMAMPALDPEKRFLVTGCTHTAAPGFLAVWDRHDLGEPRAWIPADPDLSTSVLGPAEDGAPAREHLGVLAASTRLVAEAVEVDEDGTSLTVNLDQALVVPAFVRHNAQAARGEDWVLAQVPPWGSAHKWVVAPEGRAAATWDTGTPGAFGLLLQSPIGGLWAWEVTPAAGP